MESNYQCKNCGHSYSGNFCNYCGQKRIAERWTLKKLINNAATAIFNLEKGFFYTFKKLLIQPGKVIQEYLEGNTVNYANPFRYALIGIAINVFCMLTFGVWDFQVEAMVEIYKDLGIIQTPEKEVEMRGYFKFATKFMNLLPFLLVPFISLSSKIFLERHKLYYAEHFIMNTFMLGQSTIYGALNAIVFYFIPEFFGLMLVLGFSIAAFIYSQIFRDMFGKKQIIGFLLGLVIYCFGFFFFGIFMSIISIIVVIGALIYKALT
ncbi:DUF3667 domain-containing protein [Aquimarina spongiae]|uniref:DUF3667 domain-containing protein n=1 Tax=Aquimarina spongiae TaxID=570521 RepID=A0A1M6E2H4_9FLAO|nr:DUF3667 domain-containing protein [Aquimarina spongiae]SHI79744.1 Protein of unknown function [Aquimarina spongiae]